MLLYAIQYTETVKCVFFAIWNAVTVSGSEEEAGTIIFPAYLF
jgi:hypothetical protein